MPRKNNYHVWTKSEIDFMRSEAETKKKTSAQIALNWPHVSRNSVINQCRKNGIRLFWKQPKKKKHESVSKTRQHGPLSINFEKKYKTLMPEPFEVKNPISLKDWHFGLCQWIVGDPRNMTCCGAPNVKNGPYCADHYRIAHLKEKSK